MNTTRIQIKKRPRRVRETDVPFHEPPARSRSRYDLRDVDQLISQIDAVLDAHRGATS